MIVSTIVKLLTSSLANSIDHNKSVNMVALKYFNFILLFAGLSWLSVASYWFLIDGLSVNCIAALFSSLIFGAAIIVSTIYSRGLRRIESNNDPLKLLVNETNSAISFAKSKLQNLGSNETSMMYGAALVVAGLIGYRVLGNNFKKLLNLTRFF